MYGIKALQIFSTWFGLYITTVAICYLLIYRLPSIKTRKLQTTSNANLDLKSQILISIAYLVLTAILGVIFSVLANRGFFQIYTQISTFGLGYFAISIVLQTILFDLYFYISHRLLHTKFLYSRIHYLHHRIKYPTVTTTLALHPLESVNVFIFQVLLNLLLPMHPLALIVGHLIIYVGNTIGHFGHEIFPKKLRELLPLLGTASFHDLHHKHERCNYGFFFMWYDKKFRTIQYP